MSRPLRILVVNWQDRENPQSGGAETHLHEIFGRLACAGHEVTLLVSGWKGCRPRATLDGMDVHRTGGRYTFSLAAPAYYRRLLAGRGFDVVVEDLNKVPLFTPAWVPAPSVLLVHHLFGTTAFEEASFPVAAATWLLELGVPRAFAGRPVVAVSQSTREDLGRRGLDPRPIEVIPNGIEPGRYRPATPADRAAEPTVVFLGRIKKYKRVDLVLEAVRRLRDRGRPVRLVVGGKGDHAPALQDHARRLGLAEAVDFPGFLSEEDKQGLFRSAWVHALTSPKEGWGIANIEAAACGTPTVASDAPGLRESVVHGETGLLVPHGDVAALADALDRILSDPGLRDAMGRRARAFAEGFSWDASADAMASFLKRVVQGAGTR